MTALSSEAHQGESVLLQAINAFDTSKELESLSRAVLLRSLPLYVAAANERRPTSDRPSATGRRGSGDMGGGGAGGGGGGSGGSFIFQPPARQQQQPRQASPQRRQSSGADDDGVVSYPKAGSAADGVVGYPQSGGAGSRFDGVVLLKAQF